MNASIKSLNLGVLAIQGSVKEHIAMLQSLGVKTLAVKTVAELNQVDGLIISGGESTTIGKLCHWYGLDKAIIKRVKDGLPVYGTCAGAILLAKKILGSHRVKNLSLINITIERNAYGRQIDSFSTKLSIKDLGKKPLEAIFIRAPRLKKIGQKVKILAKYQGEPVMVREGNILVSMFHPELTKDKRIHEYFIRMIKLSKHQITNNT